MKNIILTIAACCFLSGCKLPAVAFTEGSLDLPYVKQLALVAGGFRGDPLTDPMNRNAGPEDTAYAQMRIYASVLQETMIVRNGLVEPTIMNATHPSIGNIEPMTGNEFRLYMAVMGNRTGDLAVYLPAMFDASGICMRIGPAWIGTWNAGEFSFYKTLQHRADRKGGPGRWFYDRRENEDRKTGSIILYGTGGSLRKQSVRIVTDKISNIASLDSFRVMKIFRRSPSQIGADKGVMFDIPAIFMDSSALRFNLIYPKASGMSVK
jgi:hypothetical protein